MFCMCVCFLHLIHTLIYKTLCFYFLSCLFPLSFVVTINSTFVSRFLLGFQLDMSPRPPHPPIVRVLHTHSMHHPAKHTTAVLLLPLNTLTISFHFFFVSPNRFKITSQRIIQAACLGCVSVSLIENALGKHIC